MGLSLDFATGRADSWLFVFTDKQHGQIGNQKAVGYGRAFGLCAECFPEDFPPEKWGSSSYNQIVQWWYYQYHAKMLKNIEKTYDYLWLKTRHIETHQLWDNVTQCYTYGIGFPTCLSVKNLDGNTWPTIQKVKSLHLVASVPAKYWEWPDAKLGTNKLFHIWGDRQKQFWECLTCQGVR